VKEIVYDLRPIQLDRLGLTKSIEDLVDKVASAHEFSISRNIADIDGVFPKEFENSIYRIVQESLNNIVKHAGATRAAVRVTKHAHDVEVSIQDDGKGFEVDATDHKGGFGLTGMIERARLLGGHATIESSQGGGTTVKVVVPLVST
jgi:signal transduction histidine kinase